MIYDPDKECEIMVNRMKEFCEMRASHSTALRRT